MNARPLFFLNAVLLASVLGFVLLSCGGGGGKHSSTSPNITFLEISPHSVLFAPNGQSTQLSARAFDAEGRQVATTFNWSSSDPSVLSVDASGWVTPQGKSGSATITAEAAGITSNSVFAYTATPAAGAILVSDDQVSGQITINEPDSLWGIGSQYTVTLEGITPPDIGSILVGTGAEPVGGRVVSSTLNGKQVIVVLEVVAIEDLFDELVINATIDLSNEPYLVDESLAADYDISERPDGTVLFTLKSPSKKASTTARRPSGPIGTSVLNPSANFGPFTCSSSIGSMPLYLNSSPASISVNTGALAAIIEYDSTDPSSLRRLGIQGSVEATFKTELTLTAAFEGKVTCKLVVLDIPLPPLGALAPFFGGWVPLGVGFEAGGKLELAQVGFKLENQARGSFEGGLQWDSTGNWDLFGDSSLEAREPKFEFISPDLGADLVSLYSNLRLKPEIMLFGSADLELGLRGGRVIRYIFGGATRAQLVSARIGPKLGGDFAIVEGQIFNESYKSDYRLELEATLGPGDSITNLLNFFGLVNASTDGLKFTEPLATSPTSTQVRTDKVSYTSGQTVNFSVKLDAASVSIPILGYNVEEIRIYRKADPAAVSQVATMVASQTATDNQTDFDISWIANEDGNVPDRFFAFVKTRAVPFELFGDLELDQVGSPVVSSIYTSAYEYSNGSFTCKEVNHSNDVTIPAIQTSTCPVSSSSISIDGSIPTQVNIDVVLRSIWTPVTPQQTDSLSATDEVTLDLTVDEPGLLDLQLNPLLKADFGHHPIVHTYWHLIHVRDATGDVGILQCTNGDDVCQTTASISLSPGTYTIRFQVHSACSAGVWDGSIWNCAVDVDGRAFTMSFTPI